MEKQTVFWIGRLNVIKMSLLLKLTYKFNAVPFQNSFFPLLLEHISDSNVYMEE